jgi:hypothetical protein
MALTLTCFLCRHSFDADPPPHAQYVDCPSCRVRVPVVRPPAAQEDVPFAEFAPEEVEVVTPAADIATVLPAVRTCCGRRRSPSSARHAPGGRSPTRFSTTTAA